MFANIGSAEYNVDESAATLNFAARARKVEMGKVSAVEFNAVRTVACTFTRCGTFAAVRAYGH